MPARREGQEGKHQERHRPLQDGTEVLPKAFGLGEGDSEVVRSVGRLGLGPDGHDDDPPFVGGRPDQSIARPDAKQLDHLNHDFAVVRHCPPSKRVLFGGQHTAGQMRCGRVSRWARRQGSLLRSRSLRLQVPTDNALR